MTALILRLAGPLQSWSGYRLMVNMDSLTPTEPMPRKSGITGLIGAALGTRDLSALGGRYDLHARIERTNPTAEDFQTLGPLPGFTPTNPGKATLIADRHEKIRTARGRAAFPAKRDGGNFHTAITRKDYLAHSEYIVALEADDDTVADFAAAVRTPRFMTYLGRKSCPPTFPFILGTWTGTAADLFDALPHVPRGRDTSTQPLRTYKISGDYDLHQAEPTGVVAPTIATDRKDQLSWVSRHLSR